ncbi:alpha/beta fold hydrolase [Pseudomonas aeruginosa]|uniref:alpha/beta fold hydrolase n=1 Tax=Pseudomonas aeruginosa TaxID=287 RepID=UPI000D87453A|nr:alpha/beta hydrolase [Pseudomonas aeruginosa]SPY61869.1 chloroperoxidase [Pseudomonas aeruginosa]
MGYVTTKDGVELFYKDWGPRDAQVIYFHHGWPLSSDDWDAQMLFFLAEGFRVVAHDRRGHGRSSQVWDGHDMDHYADDVAAVVERLGVRGAIHVGHSTGGGEVVHYIARYPDDPVPKAAIISAVPPLMVKTEGNPGGLPKSVFDDLQAQLAANRAAVLPGHSRRPVLWLQPSRGAALGRDRPQLVAAGHDGRRQGPLRWDRGLFPDRLQR